MQITETQPAAHGLLLRGSSSVTARNVTITGSAGDGFHIEAASGVLFLTSLTNVSNNGGANANCTDSLSWIGGDLTGVAKPIKCAVVK